jgi:uncharacterized caspase-like protein
MRHRRIFTRYLALGALLLPLGIACAQPPAARPRGFTPEPPQAGKIAAQGKYYAVCIGNNQYLWLNKLQTAVADANSVAQELKQHFGFFKVDVLENADRHKILTTLNLYRKVLTPDDSLLIYYAGHGYSDDKLQKAYWLPVDAKRDDTTDWISADVITDSVKILDARQVLIVSDSCYSGKLTRDAAIDLSTGSAADRDKFLANIRKRKARLLLSSGGNEPVSDGGGEGNHSIFAAVFLHSLEDMKLDRFTVDELFSLNIRQRVGGRSKQVPELNPLRDSGHDGGTFIFERVGARPLGAGSAAGSPAAAPKAGPSRTGGGDAGEANDPPSSSVGTQSDGCDIEALKFRVGQGPKNEAALTALAICSYNAGQFAASIVVWNQLIELNPGNAGYYASRGLAKLSNDAAAGARKDFEVATQKDVKNGQYWAGLGQANEQLDNPQEAAKCFDKAIRLGAKTKDNYLGLARAYDKTGNPDLAAEARGLAAKIQ